MVFLFFFLNVLRPICLPVPEALLLLSGLKCLGETTAFFAALSGTVAGIGIMRMLSGIWSDWIIKKIHCQKQLEAFYEYVEKNKYQTIGILFVVPVFPDILICIGAAVLKIKLSYFIFIAIISKTVSIGMIIFSNEIAKICNVKQWQIILVEMFIIQALSWLMKFLKSRRGRCENVQ